MNERIGIPGMPQQGSGKKRRWRFVLKLLLSLSLVGFVISFLDVEEMMTTLSAANPWYLWAFIVVLHVGRGLMAYKWNLLLRAANVQVRLRFLFQTYCVSPLAGMVLPASIGSDLFRLYSLSRLQVNMRSIVASIIVERVIGVVTLLIVTAASVGIAYALFKDNETNVLGVILAVVTGTLTTVVVIGMAHYWGREYFQSVSERFKQGRFMKKLYEVYRAVEEYRHHRYTLASVSFWSVVEHTVPIACNFLLVHALYINVSLLELIAIIPPVVLAIRLPISIDGLGVQEGLFVALFGLVGVSATQALLLSGLNRILILLSGLPWAIHYLITAPGPVSSGVQSRN